MWKPYREISVNWGWPVFPRIWQIVEFHLYHCVSRKEIYWVSCFPLAYSIDLQSSNGTHLITFDYVLHNEIVVCLQTQMIQRFFRALIIRVVVMFHWQVTLHVPHMSPPLPSTKQLIMWLLRQCIRCGLMITAATQFVNKLQHSVVAGTRFE